MVLPPAVIASKLLDASQLNSNNRKLVLTAVDYNKVNTLFDQIKNALQKFHWQQEKTTTSDPIKIEAALEKILEDQPDMSLPKALYWAINVKNALQIWSGFSSY